MIERRITVMVTVLFGCIWSGLFAYTVFAFDTSAPAIIYWLGSASVLIFVTNFEAMSR